MNTLEKHHCITFFLMHGAQSSLFDQIANSKYVVESPKPKLMFVTCCVRRQFKLLRLFVPSVAGSLRNGFEKLTVRQSVSQETHVSWCF